MKLSAIIAHWYNQSPRVCECMLAWMMVAWGITTIVVTPIMAGPVYKYILAVMQEDSWGWLALAFGVFRLTALCINGLWRRTPLLRFIGAMFGFIFWFTLGSFYMLAVIDKTVAPFPGLSFYPIFAFFEVYASFRCGQDARAMQSFAKRTP
jgi:hypothetical protein